MYMYIRRHSSIKKSRSHLDFNLVHARQREKGYLQFSWNTGIYIVYSHTHALLTCDITHTSAPVSRHWDGLVVLFVTCANEGAWGDKYLYIYTYMYSYSLADMCVLLMYTYVYIYVCITDIYTWHVLMRALDKPCIYRPCIYIYVYIYMYIYIYIYIYTYMYIYIHMYI